MTEALEFLAYLLFLYYSTTNLVYLVLLFESVMATFAYHRLMGTLLHRRLRTSALTPPISILVPARNEEKTIVESVRSLLALEYPEYEVIVVNDGSTDNTLGVLREAFDLMATDILHVSEIPTSPVRQVYMSARDRRLVVLDKQSCGRKADALKRRSGPYVCAIDADAVLEKEALLRIMAPALTDPRRVVASGGIVRAVNGSKIEKGEVRKVKLPGSPLEVLQVLEYLRAFLIGRQGWARLSMLLIISGAFGVFRRDICRRIGGFRSSAIGEDMDLIVRLHRRLLEDREDYRIAFVPDPVCWTEVPSTLKSLARQRARWQNGLADVLWQNRVMTLNPRYGRIGMIALPYQWLFEFAAPVFELLGWVSMIAAALLGLLSASFFFLFILLGYLFGAFVSVGSVLLEEMVYHRYNDWRDLVRLLAYCFLEHFPYRQLNSIWRLKGLWEFATGRNAWQLIERVGFERQPSAAAKP